MCDNIFFNILAHNKPSNYISDTYQKYTNLYKDKKSPCEGLFANYLTSYYSTEAIKRTRLSRNILIDTAKSITPKNLRVTYTPLLPKIRSKK